MTFNYTPLSQTAIRQVSDKGRSVTYKRQTNGTYAPSTDSVTGDSETQTTIKAVVTNARTQQIDGSLVKRGDKFMLITDVIPAKGDKIVDGDTYRIVDIEEIKTGSVAIAYKVQVRR